MLSDYIIPGNRIELQSYGNDWMDEKDDKKIYQSKVYDVLSEERLDVMMPMEKGQLQLLPVDGTYNVVIYSDRGLFECYARVADRYRSNNMYILTLDLTSPLQKLQRREYYRFGCAISLKVRELTDTEKEYIRENPLFRCDPDIPMDKAMMVDISGGGARFTSTVQYEEGSRIYMVYELPAGKQLRTFRVIARVLISEEMEKKPGTFEHRVQYTNIDEDNREDIIHYIFEEERKLMRRN